MSSQYLAVYAVVVNGYLEMFANSAYGLLSFVKMKNYMLLFEEKIEFSK